jgi:hypothetical protein
VGRRPSLKNWCGRTGGARGALSGSAELLRCKQSFHIGRTAGRGAAAVPVGCISSGRLRPRSEWARHTGRSARAPGPKPAQADRAGPGACGPGELAPPPGQTEERPVPGGGARRPPLQKKKKKKCERPGRRGKLVRDQLTRKRASPAGGPGGSDGQRPARPPRVARGADAGRGGRPADSPRHGRRGSRVHGHIPTKGAVSGGGVGQGAAGVRLGLWRRRRGEVGAAGARPEKN